MDGDISVTIVELGANLPSDECREIREIPFKSLKIVINKDKATFELLSSSFLAQ